MKKLITLVLLAVAMLSLPSQADARIFGGGFRGGFGNRGFNNGYGFRFGNSFYGSSFANFGGYGSCGLGYSSFAYQPVAVIQLVPQIQYVPTVAVQQVAYSAPAPVLVAEAQPVYALPQFQAAYAQQTIYSSPLLFANACYGNAGLFNANFGRYGLNHGAFFGGRGGRR